jgi:hypothetical protein
MNKVKKLTKKGTIPDLISKSKLDLEFWTTFKGIWPIAIALGPI